MSCSTMLISIHHLIHGVHSMINTQLNMTEKLNIFKTSNAGYRAENYFLQFTENYRADAVNIVNLLAEEDFAVNSPVEYEKFLNLILRENVNKKRITVLYGHTNLMATELAKYASVVWKYTVTDGYLFWRSVKPLGPVYYVKMEPEKGTMEFVRMI